MLFRRPISTLQLLELAAAAEQRLTHPVADAIVRYAQEQGAKIGSPVLVVITQVYNPATSSFSGFLPN